MKGDLTCELCDTSSGTAPAGWAETVDGAGLHRMWDWSIIRAAGEEFRSRLLAGVLRDGDRAIGLVTARLYGLGRRPLAGIVDVDCVGYSALPGFGLPGTVPASLLTTGVDPDLLVASILAFESALRDRFGARVVAVAYRQVYARELALVARGASVIREGASTAVLHNVFDGYEGYLATLSSSRRRDQVRLTHKIDANPDITVYYGPAAGAPIDIDAFHQLMIATTLRNHHARWPRPRHWSRQRFAATLALPGTEVLSYTDADGGLLAAGITFDHPTSPILGPWGSLPPGAGSRRPSGLWFDQFNRLVRRGIEDGRRLFIMGKGMSDLKVSLGFTPEPQWTVVRRLVA